MRNIFIITVALAGMFSCKNFDTDFPDFDYTTGYFPYQFPVRILVKGNYIYDNENDRNNTFVISAAMGGVRENKSERKFGFVVDETLCQDALFSDGTPVLPLPGDYYTLSHDSEITIPKGSMNGGVEVHLTESFFDDPLAVRTTYVVPLRITGVSGIDSLLMGNPARSDADIRVSGHWSTPPKNFTMFGIKYVNPFHGQYLYHGSSTTALNGVIVSDTTYRQQYVENNDVLFFETTGRREIATANTSFKSTDLTGFYRMRLVFDSEEIEGGDVACTVTAYDDTAGYTITGSGKFVSGGEYFGGAEKDAIYLDYTVTTGPYTYTVSETFVFRDKAVVLETFTPEIIE